MGAALTAIAHDCDADTPQCVLPEVEVFLGDVPITAYETPGGQAFADLGEIAEEKASIFQGLEPGGVAIFKQHLLQVIGIAANELVAEGAREEEIAMAWLRMTRSELRKITTTKLHWSFVLVMMAVSAATGAGSMKK